MSSSNDRRRPSNNQIIKWFTFDHMILILSIIVSGVIGWIKLTDKVDAVEQRTSKVEMAVAKQAESQQEIKQSIVRIDTNIKNIDENLQWVRETLKP